MSNEQETERKAKLFLLRNVALSIAQQSVKDDADPKTLAEAMRQIGELVKGETK